MADNAYLLNQLELFKNYQRPADLPAPHPSPFAGPSTPEPRFYRPGDRLLPHQHAFLSAIPNSPLDLVRANELKYKYLNEHETPRAEGEEDGESSESNRSTRRKSRAERPSQTASKAKGKKRSKSSQPEALPSASKKEGEAKVIMINDVECFRIRGAPSDFMYDRQIHISENFKTEFKTFIKGDFKYGTQNTFLIILKYICAFLNSYGGTMYLGIKDDGTVTGVEVSDKIQKDFEDFIQAELGKFKPHVHPWQVQIQYHNIMVQGNKLALLRRKIVQINVLCHHFNQLYVTGSDEIHIRRAASTNNLIPVEIVHLLKLRNNPLLTAPSIVGALNMAMFEEMTDEELQQIIDNTQNTLLEVKYYRGLKRGAK